jgi:hypothetical protein
VSGTAKDTESDTASGRVLGSWWQGTPGSCSSCWYRSTAGRHRLRGTVSRHRLRGTVGCRHRLGAAGRPGSATGAGGDELAALHLSEGSLTVSVAQLLLPLTKAQPAVTNAAVVSLLHGVGAAVGLALGTADGLADGDDVGTAVGASVGDSDGACEGSAVGIAVGSDVGNCVGSALLLARRRLSSRALA